jgi:hypothetical protein
MSYVSENDKARLSEDVDFICNKKLLNSLNMALEKYPEGAPVKFICRVLNLTPEAYKQILESSLRKVKNNM